MNTKGFLEDLKAAMVKNGVGLINCSEDFIYIYSNDRKEYIEFVCYISIDKINEKISEYATKEAPAGSYNIHFNAIEVVGSKYKSVIASHYINRSDVLAITNHDGLAYLYLNDDRDFITRDSYDDVIKWWKGGKE